MKTDFANALMKRRSYYELTPVSPLCDEEITNLVCQAVKHVPSAFNSQSTRVVVLLGRQHKKLWSLILEVLKTLTPPAAFGKTKEKVDRSFASGYGTLLFYEDTTVTKELQQRFPLYADHFPVWAQQTSAMHQFAVWTMLEENGLGASLQHYNPLSDDVIRQEWNIDPAWQLVAQMPFGVALDTPQEKTFRSLEERVKVYR